LNYLHDMKLKHTLLLSLVLLLTSACGGGINVQDSWTSPNLEAVKYNKIGIVMIHPNEQLKDQIESYMSDEMRAKGYPAVPTFTIFPFAGNEEVRNDIGRTEEERQAYIKERVEKFDFEALIVLSILGSEETLKSKPSVGVGISAPMTYYDANYTQYWSYANVYASTPSYYVAKDFYIEATLFDVASQELHWTAQFDISDPQSISRISEQFADKLIQVLIKEGVLIK